MRKLGYVVAAILLAACAGTPPSVPMTNAAKPFMPKSLTPEGVNAADEFLWLEDVWGERAIAWVKEQNAKTEAVFKADARYEPFRQEALAILTAQDRTPTPTFRAEGIDNFWQDAANVRGIWRHTSLASYRSGSPQWQTVLDIDALSKAENANWIFKGADCVGPAETRCLVSLSDGGKDAVVVREFDTTTKSFVPGGFNIPEGKHRIDWLDADTLLVATDFGPGTLTESGYPFIVKTLKRGQTLAQATEVYRGSASHGGYGVSPSVFRDGAGEVLGVIITRPLDTFRSETWQLDNGKAIKLELPERVSVRGMIDGMLVFTVEQDWINRYDQKVPAGALQAHCLVTLKPPLKSPEGKVVIVSGCIASDHEIFTPPHASRSTKCACLTITSSSRCTTTSSARRSSSRTAAIMENGSPPNSPSPPTPPSISARPAARRTNSSTPTKASSRPRRSPSPMSPPRRQT